MPHLWIIIFCFSPPKFSMLFGRHVLPKIRFRETLQRPNLHAKQIFLDTGLALADPPWSEISLNRATRKILRKNPEKLSKSLSKQGPRIDILFTLCLLNFPPLHLFKVLFVVPRSIYIFFYSGRAAQMHRNVRRRHFSDLFGANPKFQTTNSTPKQIFLRPGLMLADPPWSEIIFNRAASKILRQDNS